MKKKTKKIVSFAKTIRSVGKIIQAKKPQSIDKTIKLALSTAKNAFRWKKNNVKPPRVISLPKSDGAILFLLPLFAGLSALGSLTGGAASVAKAQIARKNLEEKKRHNQEMEAIAVDDGLYLKPYRKGFGLYLRPPPPSKNF